MRLGSGILLVTLWAVTPAWGNVYTVRNANDSGQYSLRRAINLANAHPGSDLIRFAPDMAGKVLLLLTPLPSITDDRTIVSGDIDRDGKPDVSVNGRRVTSGLGLVIQADDCVIEGLTVCGFPAAGISLIEATGCLIQGCHVGLNLDGTKRVANTSGDIILHRSDDNVIGGSSSLARNVIAGGSTRTSSIGITVWESQGNRIIGNMIGLTRDGTRALAADTAGVGIALTGTPSRACKDNIVGGAIPAERNIIAGVHCGVRLYNADYNQIRSNTFGLAADGSTVVPIERSCVEVALGSRGNLIGGSRSERNVFAGALFGIIFQDTGTAANKVRANYFGLSVDGTRQRRLRTGIWDRTTGGQYIGGGISLLGNYFATVGTGEFAGVVISKGGSDAVVRHNTFGVRPDGRDAPRTAGAAIGVGGGDVLICDNTIARSTAGIMLTGYYDVPGVARISRNTFRRCEVGVLAFANPRCTLGDLSAWGEGENLFLRSNTWHIRNHSSADIKAEGNAFGTRSRAEIDAKIWDNLDDGNLGLVDFIPLKDGVIPTGTAATLAIVSPAAVPTGVGAEIVLSLSAPAQFSVTVLNIAGRPIATPAREQATQAGLQRIRWSGKTDRGTQAPAGSYLVRITAQDDQGRQAQSICSLRLPE